MARSAYSGPDDCNCLAVRQAARHITQFYDQLLTPSGLRTTQFSILAKLRRLGPMTINALAAEMVMDRTTLGRNILPLERDGLIAVEQGSRDRRSKELRVTETGEARFRAGQSEALPPSPCVRDHAEASGSCAMPTTTCICARASWRQDII